MSMVMMDYIYGIWSIRDNCYECRIIPSLDEDPLPRQPQEHRPGLLFFFVLMNYQHHELEVDYMLFTLFIHT